MSDQTQPPAPLKAAVVLLAAGLSSRMGAQNKLLIEIGGAPLVRRTAQTYLAAGCDVFAVVGHEAETVRAALAGLPLTIVENPDFAKGQPTSARAGIDAVPEGYEAVLVALSDQVALRPADIRDLLGAFAESARDRILIPYFGDQRGNPVVFPPELVREMRESGRNVACRKFIDSHPELTRRYQAANDHFIIDIDTPEDLALHAGKPSRQEI
jgi:molybdenum cofactor cytidylyltransferase